jgi:type IV fimbrial biogenesis protein FimT
MRRPQQGMTIVEILITLAIIGMIMALAGPSAGVWIQNLQLRNAADGVVSGLQQAKLEALKRNTLVMFQLTDPASTAWNICIYDPLTDTCKAATASLASRSPSEGSPNARLASEVNPAPDPLTALAPGAGIPGTMTFDSFGRQAPTASANFTRVDVRNPTLSTANERRLVILVNSAGQIRMCDPKLVKANNPQGCV